jgi:uncharacterized membrane protein YhaH (DUF805 family)
VFCTQCGVSDTGKSKFCSSCGSPMHPDVQGDEQIVEIAIRSYPASPAQAQAPAAGYVPPAQVSRADTYSGMTFGAAIKSVFSKYAVFDGRATRSEYWFFSLFNFLTLIGLLAFGALISASSSSSDGTSFITFLMFVWVVGVLLPSLAVTIRRLHDAGYSGWLYLLTLVPYVGAIVVFVFTLLNSQPLDNRWGRAPKPFTSNNLSR